MKAFSFTVYDESFQVLMCLDGEGQIETIDENLKPLRFVKGRTMFLPAGLERCMVVGETTVLIMPICIKFKSEESLL